ncbi:MAG: hypothetical protein CM15mP70_03310 [Pelagibacteraceae bacterium]|nr:MAG: hypothetical protein CM15mP70_03310 [Pelagibacteraceae bacterium]
MKANEIASEHVQIMTNKDDWFLENMTSYGALFWALEQTLQTVIKLLEQIILCQLKSRKIYWGSMGREIFKNSHLSKDHF